MKNQIPPCSLLAVIYGAILPVTSYSAVTSVEVMFSPGVPSPTELTYPSPVFDIENNDAASYSYIMDTGVGSSAVTGGTVLSATSNLTINAASIGLGSNGAPENISGLSKSYTSSTQFYITNDNIGTLGGQAFKRDDILLYDLGLDSATVFWDGDSAATSPISIDALHVYQNGTFLISTTAAEVIYGTSIRDGDILFVDPVAMTSTIFLSEDIFDTGADIRAISIDETTGNLLFTTQTNDKINGVKFNDDQIVMWDGTTASVVFDGSEHFESAEEITAIGMFSMTPIPEPSSVLLILASTSMIIRRRRLR
ncbi:PEP-CTERM sorting domain-containing protein [Verrucomicrobiaceae bacterium 227]